MNNTQINRETLREFSISLHNEKGDKYIIRYGYDVSMNGAEFYVKASINDSDFSSNKKTLDRVRKLKIDGINALIDLIGCNETGISDSYITSTYLNFQNYVQAKHSKKDTTSYAEIIANTTGIDIKRVNEVLQRVYNLIKDNKEKNAISIFDRFIDSSRLNKLMNVRTALQMLRKMHLKGVTINNNHSGVRYEGFLKKNHYPVYYKRDIDLIRISRKRIYEMLGREYKPA